LDFDSPEKPLLRKIFLPSLQTSLTSASIKVEDWHREPKDTTGCSDE
jgi:hypothetical protein